MNLNPHTTADHPCRLGILWSGFLGVEKSTSLNNRKGCRVAMIVKVRGESSGNENLRTVTDLLIDQIG